MIPSLCSLNLLGVAHRTQGNKNTEEQSDEEIYRARSGSVLSVGASSPTEWLGSPSWYGCIPTWSLQSHTFGILRRHDRIRTPFLILLPSARDLGSMAESSKLLIKAWFFQPSPGVIQELTRVTSLEQKTLLSPRKSPAFP